MRSRAWVTVCVLLAIACGGGHKPPTDNGPDKPFPFLDGDENDGTASLDNRDSGIDGGPDTDLPDSGVGSAGSVSPSEDGGGVAGSTGGTGGGMAGSGGQAGSAGAGAGADAGPEDAGTSFVPDSAALVGSWSGQYKVVSCSAEVTAELLSTCDTPGTCSSLTLAIDSALNVTGTELISMALGSIWSDDTLTQTQKDNLGSDSELTLWFVDEYRILGREWSAGSQLTGGFEVCRGIRATRTML